MDWAYIRIWGFILVLVALGAALLWALGFAVYLNRIHSRGWASTRRLLKSSLWVFLVALTLALLYSEGSTLWSLARGRLGSIEGQFRTGLLYQEGDTFLRPNPKKAVGAFRRAAEGGHALAQLSLARACYYGLGTPRDPVAALRWARASARQGQPFAMALSGEILQGTSPTESASFFRQAAPLFRAQADKGDAQACFFLGHLFQNGQGVARDPVEALAWMLVAQRLGVAPLQSLGVQSYGKSLSPDQRTQAQTRADAWIRAKGRAG